MNKPLLPASDALPDETNTLAPVPAALELDLAKYAPFVADFDLTEEQAQEMLESLWAIMRSFVDLGFRVDICAQLFEEFNAASGDQPDAVYSSPSTETETPSQTNGKGTAK